ncbi:ATP-binding protein [Algoriphagus aquatilis]|uniref:ATP-binding protein n=1 Tax=Algoriphagus aquatilis TaxID=490186 RepID=A0ABW0C1X7_9BACT|nr:ATP-binding protein [Algoriphagus sp.]
MKSKLNLSCQTSALSELRSFLQRTLTGFQLSEIEKHQITLAVEEVCANLIIHSHGCNPEDEIELEVKDLSEALIFEITDQGLAFNLLEYDAPDLKKVMVEKRKGGLGIILVKKIMDKIEFESNNGKNTCRLIKKFRS